jgi:two-component system, sensor histidine kinase and response regulator
MAENQISQASASTILIVDDNPQNLQVLGKILQENNYKIEFSISGEAALNWVKTKKFDLILLDINMPGLNGFEVCRRMRSNPEMDNVPIIFLSADADRESILKGFELGAQDYVTKPFDSRELLVRAKTHLKLKDSLQKLAKFNKVLEEKVVVRTLELKQSNEKLKASNLKLYELDKAKTGFLNLISHEIRTPLNGISGPLELLKHTVDIGEIGELVKILDISVQRLESFAADALLITRLKTKQTEIKREEVHLLTLIEELLEEEKRKFQSVNINVKDKSKIRHDLITGETLLIKKCIYNIIDNAIRYSPEDRPVEIIIYDENQTVVCDISDSGKGFAEGDAERVFELFTTDDEYKDNSIGIGLTICKMIMEAHLGSIIIGNNHEGGAFVKLVFNNSVQV